MMSDVQLEELLVDQPEAIQDEILDINTEARDLSLQVALLVTLLAALIGVANAFRMMRLPDPAPTNAGEGTARRLAQHEAGAEVVARVEDEPVLARPERRALDLGEHAAVDAADQGGAERRPDDGVVAPALASSSRPSSASSAVRADVAEPVGERSTSPSANTTTLRWCAGPSSSWITVP